MPLLLPTLPNMELSLRDASARLRMLRMAVDVHLGRDPSALRDPLGDGPFAVARVDGGVRIASAGSTENRKLERFVAR